MTTGKKLLVAVLTMVGSFFSSRFTGWFALLTLCSLPACILYALDYFHELAAMPARNRQQTLGLSLFAVPVGLFGLLSCAMGLAIAGWVLYNSLIAPQPEFTGSFMYFGMAPALVLFGAGMVYVAVSAWRQH